MKININNISPEGLNLEEDILPSTLDLETDIMKFRGPIKVEAGVSKITNTVTVDLSLKAAMCLVCSRCLEETQTDIKKNLKLNYQADKLNPIIDLSQDIREEIILEYPIKPLCKPDCLGLCPKCGKNLNAGECDCKSK
jgi:uncharacterized protein